MGHLTPGDILIANNHGSFITGGFDHYDSAGSYIDSHDVPGQIEDWFHRDGEPYIYLTMSDPTGGSQFSVQRMDMDGNVTGIYSPDPDKSPFMQWITPVPGTTDMVFTFDDDDSIAPFGHVRRITASGSVVADYGDVDPFSDPFPIQPFEGLPNTYWSPDNVTLYINSGGRISTWDTAGDVVDTEEWYPSLFPPFARDLSKLLVLRDQSAMFVGIQERDTTTDWTWSAHKAVLLDSSGAEVHTYTGWPGVDATYGTFEEFGDNTPYMPYACDQTSDGLYIWAVDHFTPNDAIITRLELGTGIITTYAAVNPNNYDLLIVRDYPVVTASPAWGTLIA